MSERLAKRVLLIGWDAADWKAIRPLLEAGEMPALEGLINQGVMGNIATLRPMLSPMLWTSIATGVRPFKHGILGFTEPDPDRGGVRPITNISRKVKAVWNILHQNGLTSNVIGWWPSHPAEPIRGVMVSNHYQRAEQPIDKPWPMAPGTVHPASKAKLLAPLRIHPSEIPEDALDLFIPLGREIDQSKDKRLFSCARILADCSSIHACATAVIQNEPWDFMAVYYDAIDHFGHGFMKYHPPRQPQISERDFELYKDVVASGYRYHDMMLETLLKLAGEDTTVILLSDHGFHPDHLRPARIPDEPAGPAVEHSPFGIFVMKGPGIRKDERIYGTTLLDVAPTVLTLFGIPIGRNLDGKPILQAFEKPPVVETIPSWEDVPGGAGCHPPNLQLDPVESQEAIRQLVALGYIDDPGDDKSKAADQAVRELNYNLAQAYIDVNRWRDALPLLERLWADYPDEIRFATLLAHSYRQLGRPAEFRATVEAVVRTRHRLKAESIEKLKAWKERFDKEGVADGEIPEKLTRREQLELRRLRSRATASAWSDLPLMTALLLSEGKEEEALANLERLEQADPRRPYVHRHIGQVYTRMRRPVDAERVYRKGLDIDPQDAHCHFGLAVSCYAQKKYEEAAEAALSAVGLMFYFPQAHFRLGLALERLGYPERAAEAFRVAVGQAPGFVQAHLRLSRLYKRHLGDLGRSALHLSLAQEARKRQKSRMESVEAEFAMPTADAAAPLPVAAAVNPDEVITLVSGLPRSGTSVMMQMLAAAGLAILTDEKREPDADNPHGYFEDERVKQLARDASWLKDAQGKVVKVVAQLLPYLPPDLRYRVIFMERDLDEVLASQQAMIDRLGREGARTPRERLKRTFEDQVRRMKALLHTRQIPTLFVSYRDVMDDGAAVAARVSAFLGGAHNIRAMAQAVDPKLGRHRKTSPVT